jgi:hypothetical protein
MSVCLLELFDRSSQRGSRSRDYLVTSSQLLQVKIHYSTGDVPLPSATPTSILAA